MYAICEIKGKQYKVEPGKEYRVDLLNLEENSDFEVDRVLLAKKEDGTIEIGTPYIENAKVITKVVKPVIKGNKVYAFKYKRRKGYHKKIGHRQKYSVIKIEKIEI